jgi:hypothetical protein
MALPVSAQSSIPQVQPNNIPDTTENDQSPSLGSQLFDGAYDIVFQAGAGYLAGYLGIINPIGGAIFGATSVASTYALNFLAERLGINNTCLKVAIWSLSFVASLAIAAAVTTAAGFPITLMGALGLTLAMVVTSIAISIVKGSITCAGNCCGACLGGAALALADRRA